MWVIQEYLQSINIEFKRCSIYMNTHKIQSNKITHKIPEEAKDRANLPPDCLSCVHITTEERESANTISTDDGLTSDRIAGS